MNVTYIGLVRHAAGVGEEGVELPTGATVRDLLHLLADKHGAELRDALFEDHGQVCRFLRVLAGNTDIDEMNGFHTLLDGVKDVALVIVIPQFAGG